jgi:WD40 repeat protein
VVDGGGGGLQHCAGVNALQLSADGRQLFTASRDASVKRWSLSGAAPRMERSFDGHTDWVNAIALMGSTLLSCSSDNTVKVSPPASRSQRHPASSQRHPVSS